MRLSRYPHTRSGLVAAPGVEGLVLVLEYLSLQSIRAVVLILVVIQGCIIDSDCRAHVFIVFIFKFIVFIVMANLQGL